MTLSSRFFLLLLIWPATLGLVWYSYSTWRESREFLSQARFSTGQVVRIEPVTNGAAKWTAVVGYDVDGITFTTRGRPGPKGSMAAIGEKVEVACLAGREGDGRIVTWTEFYFLPTLIAGFACLLGFAGTWQGHAFFRLAFERGRLAQRGERVTAEVVRFERAKGYGSAKHPWMIVCRWHNSETKEAVEFVSEPVWRDPAQFVQIGATIAVFVDPKNPNSYLVDLEPYRQIAYADIARSS